MPKVIAETARNARARAQHYIHRLEALVDAIEGMRAETDEWLDKEARADVEHWLTEAKADVNGAIESLVEPAEKAVR